VRNLIASALAALALSGCVSSYGTVVSERPVPLSQKQQSEAKAAVTYRLNDPESATFRNIRGKQMNFDSGTTLVQVCGEVNGKNVMGGYAGYRSFHGEFDEAGKFTLRNVDTGTAGLTENMSHYACK
jgi:hypothetical protein